LRAPASALTCTSPIRIESEERMAGAPRDEIRGEAGAAAGKGSRPASERHTVVLGTATPGGGFPLFGAAFAEALGETDPDLAIETRNTKGSTENVTLLGVGALDIALVQGEVAGPALAGQDGAGERLTVVAAMYATAGLFAVLRHSPHRAITDLRGLPVVLGARGSGLVVLARTVLSGLGLDPDKDFRAITLDRAGDGPAMVMAGEAAALWGGGIGWPGFTALTEGPGGARFIAPDAAERARILARHPFLKESTVPPLSYAGQTEPITSVGSWSLVLAGPRLSEDAGYRIARALHRAEGRLGARLAQARETTLANTWAATPSGALLHPGVRRYLKEAGLSD